jgi:ABC-type amino acid transport system permease subunit
VYELFQDADAHYSNTFRPVEYFIAVAFWYLVLTSVWTLLEAAIERKLAASEHDHSDGGSIPMSASLLDL